MFGGLPLPGKSGQPLFHLEVIVFKSIVVVGPHTRTRRRATSHRKVRKRPWGSIFVCREVINHRRRPSQSLPSMLRKNHPPLFHSHAFIQPDESRLGGLTRKENTHARTPEIRHLSPIQSLAPPDSRRITWPISPRIKRKEAEHDYRIKHFLSFFLLVRRAARVAVSKTSRTP